MNIEILGPGCRKCDALDLAAQQAISELGIDATITKVTDYGEIARRGAMSTPGLTIDGALVSVGRVLTVDDIKTLLTYAA